MKRKGGALERNGKRKKPRARKNTSSVARTRGAAVTGEMKYFDSTLLGTSVSEDHTWANSNLDPTTLNTLFAPSNGAGVTQRIGKACKVMKLRMRFHLQSAQQTNQTVADPSCDCRIILFQDTQSNAAQPAGTLVMTGGSNDYNGILQFQNIDNFGRFKVLMDKTINLQNPTMTYDGTNIEQSGISKVWKFTKKFKVPVTVRFNAVNGGTIADIVDHSWHVIGLCNNDELIPQLSYQARFCFKE